MSQMSMPSSAIAVDNTELHREYDAVIEKLTLLYHSENRLYEEYVS